MCRILWQTWAYQTSKWSRDVRTQTNLEITWKLFSLEEINRIEGKKYPWEREWSYGWSMLRISAMLRRQSMDDVDRYYKAAGRADIDEQCRPYVETRDWRTISNPAP